MGERERVIEIIRQWQFDAGKTYELADRLIAANLIRGASLIQGSDPAFRKTSWDLRALLALPLDERNKILEDAAEKGAHLYAWSEVKP